MTRTQTLARSAFRAMGTEIDVLASPDLPDDLLRRVQAWFTSVESHLSRFRRDSELSILNRSAGRPFLASWLLYRVLEDALTAAEAATGLFDPTVLKNVRAAGYRKPFERFGPRPVRTSRTSPADHRAVRMLPGRCVVLQQDVGIDLGGFAKGWTVDRCEAILGSHPSWLVNAGGDLLARGPGPEGNGWLVGVEDPLLPGADLFVLRVHDRAVATSSVIRRRWQTDTGEVAHHIIDPRTGRPAETDLASVTVIADSVAGAEVEAKVLLLLGRREAARRSEFTGMPAVLVSRYGEITLAAAAGAFIAS